MAQRVLIDNLSPQAEETGHVFSLVKTPKLINCYPEPKSPDETSFYPRNCKDVWNENRTCDADDPYYQPLAEGDELIIQTRFFDDINFNIGDDSCEGLEFNQAYWEFDLYNSEFINWGQRLSDGNCIGCFRVDESFIPDNHDYAIPFIRQGNNTGNIFSAVSQYINIDIGCFTDFTAWAEAFFNTYFNALSIARIGCDPTPFGFIDTIIESSLDWESAPSGTYAKIRVLFNKHKLEQLFPKACTDGLSVGFITPSENPNVSTPRYESEKGLVCCDKNASCYLFGDDGCIGTFPNNGPPVRCPDSSLLPGTARYSFEIYDIPGVEYSDGVDDFGRPEADYGCGSGNPYIADGVYIRMSCNGLITARNYDEEFTCFYDSNLNLTWSDYNVGSHTPQQPTQTIGDSLGLSGCATDFDDYVDRIIAYFTATEFSTTNIFNITKTPVSKVIDGNNRSGYTIEYEFSIAEGTGVNLPCFCTNVAYPVFRWYYNPFTIGPYPNGSVRDAPCLQGFPHEVPGYEDVYRLTVFDDKNDLRDGSVVNPWQLNVTNPSLFPQDVNFVPTQAGVYRWDGAAYVFQGEFIGDETKIHPIITNVQNECCPLEVVDGEEGQAKFEFSVNIYDLIIGSKQDEDLVNDFAIFIPFDDLNCELFSYDTVPDELKAINYETIQTYVEGFIAYWNAELLARGNSGTVSFILDPTSGTATFTFLLNITAFALEYGYNPCEAAIPICVYHSDKYLECADGFRELVFNFRTESLFNNQEVFRINCGALQVLEVVNTTFNTPNENDMFLAIEDAINNGTLSSKAVGISRTQMRIHFSREDFPEFCNCVGEITFNTTIPESTKFDIIYDSGACCTPRNKCNFTIDGYVGFPVDLRGWLSDPTTNLAPPNDFNIFGASSLHCWTGDDVSTAAVLGPAGLMTGDFDMSVSANLRTRIDEYVTGINRQTAESYPAINTIVTPWYEDGELKGYIHYVDESLLAGCDCGNSVIDYVLETAANSYRVVSDSSICCDAQVCPYPDGYLVLEFTLNDPGVYNANSGLEEGCFATLRFIDELCPVGCNSFDSVCLSESNATNFDEFKAFVVENLTQQLRFWDPNAVVSIVGTSGKIIFNRETFRGDCSDEFKICDLDCESSVAGNCEGYVEYDLVIPAGTFDTSLGYDMQFLLNCPGNPGVIYVGGSNARSINVNAGETIGEAIVRVFSTTNTSPAFIDFIHIPPGGGVINETVRVRLDYNLFNNLSCGSDCDCIDPAANFGPMRLQASSTDCTGIIEGTITVPPINPMYRYGFYVSPRYLCPNGTSTLLIPGTAFIGDGVRTLDAQYIAESLNTNIQPHRPTFRATWLGSINPALSDQIRITFGCEDLNDMCPLPCESYPSPPAFDAFLTFELAVNTAGGEPGPTYPFFVSKQECTYEPGSNIENLELPLVITNCTVEDTGYTIANVDVDFTLDSPTPTCCENTIDPDSGPGVPYNDQEVIITEPAGPNPLCCPPVIGSITVQDCCCNTYTNYTFSDIVSQQLISIDNSIPQTFQNFKINWENLPSCFSLRFKTETSEFVTDCYKKVTCEPTVKFCSFYPDGFEDCRGNIYGIGDDPCEETLDEEGEGLRFQPCVRVWGTFTLSEISIEENDENRYSAKSSSEKWRLITEPIPGYVVRQLENLFVAPYIEDEQGRQFKFINQITQNIDGSSMWHMDVLFERLDGGCEYDSSCLEIQ